MMASDTVFLAGQDRLGDLILVRFEVGNLHHALLAEIPGRLSYLLCTGFVKALAS